MSFTPATYLGLSSALLFAAACHHHHNRGGDHDPSTDPSSASDAGACSDAGCTGPGNNVLIHGEFNSCPVVAMEITPIQTFMDQPVMVTSHSVDPDGDALRFDWSSDPDSSFEQPDAPVTLFHCESIGRKTLHLSVTDARGCQASDDIQVSCIDVDDFVNAGAQQMPAMP